jgi:uncharacterized protein (UPF0371 family)
MTPAFRDEIMRKIGVSQKLFSKSQWKDATDLRAKMGGGSVGDALVKMGAINPDQLRALFRAVDYRIGRNEDKELARVILDSGYADERAVKKALDDQKELYGSTGKLTRLCDLLMESSLLSESQHIAARKILDIAKASKRGADSAPDEASD